MGIANGENVRLLVTTTFFSFGGTIGWIVGLADAPLAVYVLGAIFALGGSGALYYITKVNDSVAQKFLLGLLFFSFGVTSFTTLGLYASEHRLFSPAAVRDRYLETGEIARSGYIRSGEGEEVAIPDDN